MPTSDLVLWEAVEAIAFCVLTGHCLLGPQLSQRIKVTAFTLEHIPAALSSTGDGKIPSAPKEFSVWVSMESLSQPYP